MNVQSAQISWSVGYRGRGKLRHQKLAKQNVGTVTTFQTRRFARFVKLTRLEKGCGTPLLSYWTFLPTRAKGNISWGTQAAGHGNCSIDVVSEISCLKVEIVFETGFVIEWAGSAYLPPKLERIAEETHRHNLAT